MSQVIKKRKIVIASLLKPVDDTRMFEKMGLSLFDNGHEVHIIGFPTRKKKHLPQITFHPSRYFKRVSFYRILLPWLLLLKIRKIKPSVLIVTTHELLWVGIIIKWLDGTKLCYDVRENYFRNILYLGSFPKLLRPILALYVRCTELLTSPFIDLFFLAERGYSEELSSYLHNRSIIIENKVKRSFCSPIRKSVPERQLRLLFSGTLAESTGIFTAIKLTQQLHAINPDVSLTIIGYCAQPNVLQQIRKAIQSAPYIKLIGGDRLVPHEEIMINIDQADVGIVSYPPNRATMNTIPTKLYEYIGCQLPILLIDNKPWVLFCELYTAAIPFQPDNIDPSLLLNIKHTKFYPIPPGDEIFWESEAIKFVEAIESL